MESKIWKSPFDIQARKGFRQAKAKEKEELDKKTTRFEPYIQIFWMKKGVAYVECNEKQLYVEENQAILINCNEMYFLKELTPDAFYYQISFMPSFFAVQTCDISLEKYFRPIEENRIIFHNQLDESSDVIPILQEIVEEYDQMRYGHELMLQSLFYRLMALLLRNHVCVECSNREATCVDNCRKKFLPVFTYIEEHFTEKIQVNDMASLIDVTPCHFCRMFKQISKKTLIDYVNTVRLSKACDLLIESKQAIRQVSAICGFDDMNYFIRIFKKYYCVTPNQFRKTWNEKKEGFKDND